MCFCKVDFPPFQSGLHVGITPISMHVHLKAGSFSCYLLMSFCANGQQKMLLNEADSQFQVQN